MSGSGEFYTGSDGAWHFRATSPDVAGADDTSEIEVRSAMGALFRGNQNGPVS